jgi:multidrug efflux pump subunit AcrA (membrane-fusion protein)
MATLYAEINETGKRIVTGMSINVDIPVGRDTVFLISSSAVLNENGRPYVFVRQDGIFKKIPVEPGIKTEDKTEIRISGNQADSVVVSGFKNVHSLYNHQ